MEEITFQVQGSAAEPYSVVFVRLSQDKLSAFCSCPAGQNGQYCKHRFAILDGIQEGIVSANLADLKVIQTWLPGTDVEKALFKMRELEREAAKVNKDLSSAKRHLAKVMRG